MQMFIDFIGKSLQILYKNTIIFIANLFIFTISSLNLEISKNVTQLSMIPNSIVVVATCRSHLSDIPTKMVT